MAAYDKKCKANQLTYSMDAAEPIN